MKDRVTVFTAGGNDTWKQFHKRDYTVSLEWVLDPVLRKNDACMVIWSNNAGSFDRGMWCITRRAISEFCDEHNKPTMYCIEQCAEALQVLGRAELDSEIRALVDVVMEYVDDLIQMPIAPLPVKLAHQKDPVWEITMAETDNPNKILRESTV
jgi:hypothetical protein